MSSSILLHYAFRRTTATGRHHAHHLSHHTDHHSTRLHTRRRAAHSTGIIRLAVHSQHASHTCTTNNVRTCHILLAEFGVAVGWRMHASQCTCADHVACCRAARVSQTCAPPVVPPQSSGGVHRRKAIIGRVRALPRPSGAQPHMGAHATAAAVAPTTEGASDTQSMSRASSEAADRFSGAPLPMVGAPHSDVFRMGEGTPALQRRSGGPRTEEAVDRPTLRLVWALTPR